MRDKNFGLIGGNSPTLQVEKESQTDVVELGSGDRAFYKLSNEKLDEIDSTLLNMFIENLLPFTFVENEAFKLFAKALEPKYHFPKRKKLVTKVGMLYNTVKDSIKSELSNVDAVVFTHKSWLNMEGDMYDTVKVHYISEDWQFRNAALQTCRVSQNPRSIAEYLDNARDQWNLPEPVLVSSESEHDGKTEDYLDWKHMPCFGSCIHAVVKQCLSKAEVYRFLNQGRRLVSQVTGNVRALQMLEKKKALLLTDEVRNKTLVLDDVEKWSSMLDMISVLSEQTPALHAAIMDTELISQGVDLRSQLYAFKEQSVLEYLVKIFTPFKTASEILTKTDEPTLQKVVPIFVKLEKVLELDKDDSEMVKDVKTSLRTKIAKHIEPYRDTCLQACLLHPQTKQMAFVSPKEKEHMRNLLLSEVKEQCEQEFNDSKRTKEQFKKAKKVGMQRQTKSMSAVASDSDVRRIIVSKDDGGMIGDMAEEEEGENVEDGSPDSRDSDKEDGDVDVGDPDDDNDIGPAGESSKSNTRNVKRTSSMDSTQVGSLSITVENDWLDDVICASDDQKSPDETAKIEVNLYMAEPASNKNPLHWWKEKSPLYPHISKLAKKVLAIPASSISTEEVFLTKRNLETRQMQVKTEHVDMMLFLKENKDFCDLE